MIDEQRKALDKNERKRQYLGDIQRYLADQEYSTTGPTTTLTVATQPWVKNFYFETDYGRIPGL